ncbi:hypothetical protein [Rhodanobacter sp. C03]|uniref:hypothetical protein n=1 Tax=Rhodanobacter sp. C03 TaxID=1945858 RepID=UPI000985CBE5|nr:hypothetical protein [Rhodanobacter sp. C03]OOG54467.1 hypothetical protein B0E48_14330 [Rhodanobacter sp. C03]
MNMKRLILALAGTLLVSSVAAQTASKPLNLKLPPGDVPAASSTAAQPASSGSSPTAAAKPAPGVYYGDTSGHMSDDRTANARACDDSKYNDPQMHGSVGMGVVAGNHVSGSYQTGEVSVTKALGDCEHPSGGIGFSVSVGQGNFHGGHGF